jgi:hypothetical protein
VDSARSPRTLIDHSTDEGEKANTFTAAAPSAYKGWGGYIRLGVRGFCLNKSSHRVLIRSQSASGMWLVRRCKS